MSCAIWWIRRDLRLTDNQALSSALQAADQVVPVFILDEALLASPYVGLKRTAFLFAGLREVERSLQQAGSCLVVRSGDPEEQLTRLWRESEAVAIFAEPDYSPYARQRDQRLERSLPIQWVGSPAVKPPGGVVKSNGEPFTVFTAFSKAWKALPGPQPGMIFSAPSAISTPCQYLKSHFLPTTPALDPVVPFAAGEIEAQWRLRGFVNVPAELDYLGLPSVYDYASERDRLDLYGTSQLSPYLRLGMLSARQVVAEALLAIQEAPDAKARQSAETWLNELIWRDFYMHILYHHPRVRRENFRLPDVRWENNPDYFVAWCAGRTGYPVVDAAMRQMLSIGWMHNRARMIVASFLTKDLLVDWRWGERWFMQHLIDGDPAANNGGWQWTAGTGTDAAPYFRIFNPVSQSIRHDPQGVYIRRWLPELNGVPDEYIHEPWKMPLDVQRSTRCRIGLDYPAPVVDHAERRELVLRAYQHHR